MNAHTHTTPLSSLTKMSLTATIEESDCARRDEKSGMRSVRAWSLSWTPSLSFRPERIPDTDSHLIYFNCLIWCRVERSSENQFVTSSGCYWLDEMKQKETFQHCTGCHMESQEIIQHSRWALIFDLWRMLLHSGLDRGGLCLGVDHHETWNQKT